MIECGLDVIQTYPDDSFGRTFQNKERKLKQRDESAHRAHYAEQLVEMFGRKSLEVFRLRQTNHE